MGDSGHVGLRDPRVNLIKEYIKDGQLKNVNCILQVEEIASKVRGLKLSLEA